MKGIKTFSLFLFECTFGIQFMIVLMYWSVLHPLVMERLEAIAAHDLIVMNWVVHILPPASIFFNVIFSNIKFRYSHVAFNILMNLIFFVGNYYGVMHFNNGETMYPFFPWATDFEQSVFNGAGLLGKSMACYLASCIFVNKVLRQVKSPKKDN